ncbi:MAG: peptidylprolyl isomerase [Pigmentiphaga sp.]|nr:peptidylprolyl isomerase [Pigmentiphaga sp.]
MALKQFSRVSMATGRGAGVALSSLLAVLLAGPVQAQGLRVPEGFPPATSTPLQSAPPPSMPAQSMPLESPAPASRSRVGDYIVAVVNSDVITRRELDGRMQIALASLQQQNIQPPSQEVVERQVLERMIVERTQLQEAAAAGIQVDDTMLDRAVARIAEQNQVSVDQLRDELNRNGPGFQQYREDLRQEILMVRLREREVDSTVAVSETEIDALIEETRGQAAPAEMTLAQILVRVPEGSPSDEVARQRRKAEVLLEQLRGGADFAQLAAASSDGEEALRGGELGTRPADRWPELFLQAVSRLQPGQVSDIIQSGNGFHILKVVELTSATGVVLPTESMPVQQTKARHILLKTSQILSDEQARTRLSGLRDRLVQGGESFTELARQYSNDASAPQGGDLGWLSPSETVPEFERVMNSLEPGQVSQPIQSPFGWHLILVEDRRTQDVGRERQRSAARQTLFQRKVDQKYEDWASALRDRAYVEIRLGDDQQINY